MSVGDGRRSGAPGPVRPEYIDDALPTPTAASAPGTAPGPSPPPTAPGQVGPGRTGPGRTGAAPAGPAGGPVLSGSALIRGYPPVLGAMLVVDGIATMIAGGRATVSLGEAVTFVVLPPVAAYLVAAKRVTPLLAGVGAAAAAVVLAALFLGGGIHLIGLPAWLEAFLGAALLAAGAALLSPRRSHVGKRRRR